ncbi:uncharacterized protein LOC134820969 [Bolinopsis microptera]|uniref:uncharacterized protein LOC134820969 n=1 Tax=Bolinopsis microptera TaxID=2820187 RepID=UPI00307996C4
MRWTIFLACILGIVYGACPFKDMSPAEKKQHRAKLDEIVKSNYAREKAARLALLDPKDNPESDEYVSPGPGTMPPTSSPAKDMVFTNDVDRKNWENQSEWCWELDDAEENITEWIPKGTIRVVGPKEKEKCQGGNEWEFRGKGCCCKIPKDW